MRRSFSPRTRFRREQREQVNGPALFTLFTVFIVFVLFSLFTGRAEMTTADKMTLPTRQCQRAGS
jgi:hypothetical protein